MTLPEPLTYVTAARPSNCCRAQSVLNPIPVRCFLTVHVPLLYRVILGVQFPHYSCSMSMVWPCPSGLLTIHIPWLWCGPVRLISSLFIFHGYGVALCVWSPHYSCSMAMVWPCPSGLLTIHIPWLWCGPVRLVSSLFIFHGYGVALSV